MVPLDFSGSRIEKIITHLVGNKALEDGIQYSSHESMVEEATKEYLKEYFLQGFNPLDWYAFKHSVDLTLNTVYSLSAKLFSDPEEFIMASKEMAKELYDSSQHPKIKTGEFNLVYFKDIQYGDEILDGIGLFKSETKVPFIKMHAEDVRYRIDHGLGYRVDGIDKAAIILNSDKEDGFRVLTVDHTNKSAEASYWKDQFLKLEAIHNEFHQTKVVMDIAKTFMNDHVKDTFDLSRAEEIDLLNKSGDYFKTADQYEPEAFAEAVFDNPQMASNFQNYNKQYLSENNFELDDDMKLSEDAVKKYGRVFKSVLKLDKNFHIYIHGDKNMIIRGREVDGRKFYKIYYQNEN